MRRSMNGKKHKAEGTDLSMVTRVFPGGLTFMAQEGKVTPFMSEVLTDISAKEGLMITVEYAPGGSSPIHRHNAHAFVYVLEGSIVMQVKSGKEATRRVTFSGTCYDRSIKSKFKRNPAPVGDRCKLAPIIELIRIYELQPIHGCSRAL